MHRYGVTCSACLEIGSRYRDRFLPRAVSIYRLHRRHLLFRKVVRRAVVFRSYEQHPDAFRKIYARSFSDVCCRLSGKRRIHLSAWEHRSSDRVCFLAAVDVVSAVFFIYPDRFFEFFLRNDRSLLARADDAVVEAPSFHHHRDDLFKIDVSVYQALHIARSDSKRRSAR